MVFSNEDKEEKIVINTCNCGCGSEIVIKRFVEDQIPPEYYISINSSLFDQEQVGIFKLIGKRLKRAWFDLTGKNYLYLDICMTQSQLNEYIEKLQKIQK